VGDTIVNLSSRRTGSPVLSVGDIRDFDPVSGGLAGVEMLVVSRLILSRSVIPGDGIRINSHRRRFQTLATQFPPIACSLTLWAIALCFPEEVR
jgi:hypothetical protein